MSTNLVKDKKLSEEITKFVEKYVKNLQDLNTAIIDIYIECKNIYNCVSTDDTKGYLNPQGANIFVPILRRNVDSLHGMIMGSLFYKPLPFSLSGVDVVGTDDKTAKLNEDFMTWQSTKMNLYGKISRAQKEKIKYGTCIYKIGWNNKETVVTQKTKIKKPFRNEEGVLVGETYETKTKNNVIKIHNEPLISTIPIALFGLNPAVESIQDQPLVYEVMYMTKSELEQEEKDGFYAGTKELFENVHNDTGTNSKIEDKWLNDRDEIDGESGKTGLNEDRFKIYICWLKYDLFDKGERIISEVHFAVDGNKFFPLLIRKNPYTHGKYPYVKGILVDDDGRALGKGMIEPFRSLQYLVNDKMNQAMDYVTHQMKLTYDATEDLPPQLKKQLANGVPFGAVLEGSLAPDGSPRLRPHVLPSLTYDALTWDSRLEQFIEYGTMSKLMSGMPTHSQVDRAASSISQVAGFEQTKLAPFIEEVNKEILELADMWLYLNAQYIDDDTKFRVLGVKEPKNITPDDILTNFDIIATGDLEKANKNAKIQGLISTAQSLGMAKDENGVTVINWREVAKYLFAEQGAEQSDKFVTESPKPIDEEKEVTLSAEKENQELLAESMMEEPNILGSQLYHQLHAIIHRQLKNTPEYRMKKEEAKVVLDKHIDEHEVLLKRHEDRMNQIMQMVQQMQAGQEQPQQAAPQMLPPQEMPSQGQPTVPPQQLQQGGGI